jgi:bifunctional DNase/RNase
MHLPDIQLPRGSTGGSARRTQATPTETLLSSYVRPYVPGDALHMVHWRKTAQQQALMVRQFDLEPAGDGRLLLDLDSSVHAGEGAESTVEYGVILAASLAACRNGTPAAIEVQVRGIEIDSSARPVILLEDEDRERALPLWIGTNEAQAIAMQMQGIEPDRPLTHDLFKNTLDVAGIGFEKIVIEALRDGIYYARIHLTVNGDPLEVDSRPSDAIALALRFHKPVYVAPALFESESTIDLHGVEPSGTARSGVTVQDVTPELAAHFSLSPGEGVLVADVDERSGAELQRGDVILEVDGVAVASAQDFQRRMHNLSRQRGARLSILRDGDRVKVDIGSPAR